MVLIRTNNGGYYYPAPGDLIQVVDVERGEQPVGYRVAVTNTQTGTRVYLSRVYPLPSVAQVASDALIGRLAAFGVVVVDAASEEAIDD